jgi:hypothetical protein
MIDSVEYSSNVPATGRAVIRGISQASPPAAAGCSVRAIVKGGRHYITLACGSGSFHCIDTDGELSSGIGNNS